MNPVLINIGPLEIRWYSVLLLIAFGLGLFLIFKESNKFHIDKDYLFNLIFWTIIFGLLGARIYYVLFNIQEYSSNWLEIFKIWHGGLAIHGGIIVGALTIIIMTKKYNVNIFKITDIFVPSLILGQAIGRWGNFFNGEAHGAATTLENLKSLHIPNFIIEGMNINGVYYQPTFLYESLLCLAGFIIIILLRHFLKLKNGQLTAIYLIIYGLIRFFIESSRTDSLMLGNLKIAQIISILFVLGGIFLFLLRQKKTDLYKDEI